MRTRLSIAAVIALLICQMTSAQENNAKCNFKVGDKLEYLAWFQLGATKIDRAVIESEVSAETYKGDSVYYIKATGRTEKSFKLFYALQDTFICRMNMSDLMTRTYYQSDNEKKYRAVKKQTFEMTEDGYYRVTADETTNGNHKNITYRYKTSRPIDGLSIVYQARNLPLKKMKVGDKVEYCYFSFDENTDMSITYLGKEQVKLRDKSVHNCYKFQFFTGDGTVFTSEYPVYIWIEEGPLQRIIHAEAKLKIGYAKLDLINR